MGALAYAAPLRSIPGGRVSESGPGYDAGGEQHVRIPLAVMSCAELTPGAIVTYGWLQRHMGPQGCFPSLEALAGEVHCSLRSVKTHIAELERQGFVTHRRGGGARTNSYELHANGDGCKGANIAPLECADIAPLAAKSAKNDTLRVQKTTGKSAKNDTHNNVEPITEPEPLTNSAPTERGASAPVAAVSERPKPKAKINAVVAVIEAAGIRVAVSWAKDGDLVRGCPFEAEEIGAAYVALFRRRWGDDFMRRRISVGYVCSQMNSYWAWKSEGGIDGTAGSDEQSGGSQPAAGRDLGGVPAAAAGAGAHANGRHAAAAGRGGGLPGAPSPRASQPHADDRSGHRGEDDGAAFDWDEFNRRKLAKWNADHPDAPSLLGVRVPDGP